MSDERTSGAAKKGRQGRSALVLVTGNVGPARLRRAGFCLDYVWLTILAMGLCLFTLAMLSWWPSMPGPTTRPSEPNVPGGLSTKPHVAACGAGRPAVVRNPPAFLLSPAERSGGVGPEPGKTVQVPLLLDMRRSAPPAANCPSSRTESGSGPQDVAAERRGGSRTPVLAALLDAIRLVESSGNDRAVGDRGRSVGPYQCGLAAFMDGGGRREDYPRLAYNRAATEAVMMRYWARYRAVTDRDKAVCWNVGPRWRTRATAAGEKYWCRVQGAMR